MSGYLIDTNVASERTRDRPEARVVAFLDDAPREQIFISVSVSERFAKALSSLCQANGGTICKVGSMIMSDGGSTVVSCP
jgi:predicted nucleic acid-binding protein